MRRFLLFLFSFFSLFNGFSQSLEKTYRFGFDTGITTVLSNGQSGWILGGYYKRFDQASSPPWICMVDSIGHVIWSNIVIQTGLEEGEVKSMITTEDNGLAVIGKLLSCDAGPDASFVRKIGVTGNTEWTYTWSESTNPQSGKFNCVIEADDNGIIISRDSLLLKLSGSGDSLWTRTPADGWINSMTLLPGGDFILGTANGLSRTDSLGFLQFSRPFDHPVQKTILDPSGRINALSNNTLYRLDPFLNLIDSLIFAPWINNSLEFEVDSSRIWILGNTATSNITQLLIFDEFFSFISINQIGIPGSKTLDLAYDNNQIIYGGWQEDNSSRSGYVKTADKNGNSPLSTTDASTLSISIANYYLVPVSPLLPDLVDVYMDIDVSVVNKGQDTLRSLFLNAELSFAFLCFKARQYKEFLGFSLAPGDTGIFRFNGLRDYARDINAPFSFLIWTSDPNRKLDQNISDDSLSVLFFFSGIKNEKNNPFLVYPNPSKDYFQVVSKNGQSVDEIRLYSSTGQLVMNYSFRENENIMIAWDQHVLPGMYILEVVSNKRTYRSKLIRN